MSNDNQEARGKPGENTPFCWQSRDILNHLRAVGEAGGAVSSSAARAVYVALTEISSERRAAVFQASMADIAAKASMSVRSAAQALKIIEAAGFLLVQANYLGDGNLRTCSTYTLLRHDAERCSFCVTHSKKGPRSTLPSSEEEGVKKTEREALSSSSFEDWIRMAESEFPGRTDICAIAEKFQALYQSRPEMVTYARFQEWIKSERSPQKATSQSDTRPEPVGWKDFLRTRYPLSQYEGRRVFEDQEWSTLVCVDQDQIIKLMQS